ncbi:MAG: AzlD domain-containing protein [Bacteroidales bacterium]|nr:AzlD domain-containing protein [Bacteroidales bacterium]
MTTSELIWYLALTAITANMVRLLPILLIRGRITNRFVRSFLYYVPYVTLAVMTFPAIIQATDSPWAGTAALLLGILAAWRGYNLFVVATICCLAVVVFNAF